ncbi:hypothetical protein ACFOW4_17785 [Micromonospora sp. GCM10011542]|uniref:hypothetical protein n=1 Tax=Micromonospora sp. GCM10011542 TaxID=3317337 RepID=UPI003605E56F
MPAPVTPDARRQPPLLTVLFWVGVALAPVAALILLVADGNGPLRFAAVLAILAVVLIGLSIALRPDGDAAAARSDELLDEIEELRRELRGEIVAAAQRGNQALDQAQRAQEAVAAVRRRLEASSAALAGAAPTGAAEQPGAGRARVPTVEPVDAAPAGRSRVPAETPAGRGQVPGGNDLPAGRGRVSVPEEVPARWAEHADDEGSSYQRGAVDLDVEQPAYGADRPAAAAGYGADRPAAAYGSVPRPREQDRPEPVHRPVGVVRHTETVHVTTRHTIVDGGPAESSGRYGGGYPSQWTPPAQEWTRGGGAEERARPADRPWDEPEDRPWSARADVDDRPHAGDGRSWNAQPDRRGEPGWAGVRDGSSRVADGDGDGPGWTDRHDEPEWTGARDAYGQPDEPGWPEREPDRSARGSWAAPEDRRADRSRPEQRGAAGHAVAPPVQPGSAPRPDDTGEYWSQMRAGDRWAAVRDDEHGRELRVGERRAEVHADATGTEYRVADRWATVRRDEPRRDEPPRRDDRYRDGAYHREEAPGRYDRNGDDGWRAGRPDPADRPALPVGGVPVPQEWRPPRQRSHQPEPEPERTGRRRAEQRYGYPPQDDVPRAGGAPADDRWR